MHTLSKDATPKLRWRASKNALKFYLKLKRVGVPEKRSARITKKLFQLAHPEAYCAPTTKSMRGATSVYRLKSKTGRVVVYKRPDSGIRSGATVVTVYEKRHPARGRKVGK